MLDQARASIEARRYAEALDLVRGLVAERPDDARVQRIYGEALIATGQPSLAVWPLTRAMKDPEQAVPAGLLLARSQLQAGSSHDAIDTATRVIEMAPDDHRAYMLRSRAYLEQNVEEEAIADLDRALERGMEDETAEFVRLYALFGLGRIEEGEKLLDELYAQSVEKIDENPRRAAEMCGATAQFAYESGDLTLAEERFEGCLDGAGLRNPSLVSRAMRFYDERGRFDRATDILRRRFEADDGNLSHRVAYADRLSDHGRYEEAHGLLLEATETQPAAWSALVDHYMRREQFDRALEALDRAIEANPNPPDAWRLSRSDLLIITGRLAEAEKSLDALEVEAHRAVIEGRLLLARGRLAAAAKRFEEALVLWPDNADLRYLAGNTYERLGDWTTAGKHFREGARQDPPHYLNSIALSDIMKGLGDREGRIFVLLRLLEADPSNGDVLEAVLDAARDLGDESLVQKLFVRLSRLPGAQGRAIANTAQAARQRGTAEAALETIDTAGVDLGSPVFFETLRARTAFLLELDRRAEAVAQLSEILSTKSAVVGGASNAVASPAASHAARLYALRGELHLAGRALEAAARDFERASTLDPASLEAAIGLAEVAAARGEDERARTRFARAIELEARQSKHDAEATLAAARFELRSGRREAAKNRLRKILESRPRHGEAALALAQLLHEDARGGEPSEELLDAARRALLFEQGPEAAKLTALFPSGPDGKR